MEKIMELWIAGEIYGHCPVCKIDYSAKTKQELLAIPCTCGHKIVLCIDDSPQDNTYAIGYAHACGYRD